MAKIHAEQEHEHKEHKSNSYSKSPENLKRLAEMREKARLKREQGDTDDSEELKVTNVPFVWCKGCKEMHKNDSYIEPKHQCAKCGYPIPISQSDDATHEANKCPHCGHAVFDPYVKPSGE